MFGSRGSVQLARVFGIRIGADYSWFLILFLAIFFAREQLDAATDASDSTVFIAAVVEAFLFFGSIVAHEIGHALAARREGIAVVGIDLFLFGGLMHMRSEPETPGAEFRVAVAGPLMTLLVVLARRRRRHPRSAGRATSATRSRSPALASSTVLPVMISALALINVVVLVFNLIPAYPLDGGRIARAAVWKITGDRHRSTRAAAGVGQGFGTLLMIGGVLLALNGATFDGIYLGFLGYLLGSQARNVALQSTLDERLEGVTVADLMDPEPVTIPADLGALRAYEDFFLRYQGSEWFAVVEVGDGFVGRAFAEPVRQVAEADPERPIRELVVGEEDRVATDTPLERLLGPPRAARGGSPHRRRRRGPPARHRHRRARRARAARAPRHVR